ncbi:hypothetical protein AB4Z54_58455 [Streptomyces sp. MCAF7]
MLRHSIRTTIPRRGGGRGDQTSHDVDEFTPAGSTPVGPAPTIRLRHLRHLRLVR